MEKERKSPDVYITEKKMQSKQRRRERQGGREGAAGSTVTLSLRSEGLALRQITTVHEEVNHFLPEKETGKKMIIAALSQHSQFPKTGIPSRPRINGTVGAGNRKRKKKKKAYQYSRKPALLQRDQSEDQ